MTATPLNNNNFRPITRELVSNVHQRLRSTDFTKNNFIVYLQKSGTALAGQTRPVPTPLRCTVLTIIIYTESITALVNYQCNSNVCIETILFLTNHINYGNIANYCCINKIYK